MNLDNIAKSEPSLYIQAYNLSDLKKLYFVGYGNPRKHILVWQHLINNYKGEEKRTTRRVP